VVWAVRDGAVGSPKVDGCTHLVRNARASVTSEVVHVEQVVSGDSVKSGGSDNDLVDLGAAVGVEFGELGEVFWRERAALLAHSRISTVRQYAHARAA